MTTFENSDNNDLYDRDKNREQGYVPTKEDYMQGYVVEQNDVTTTEEEIAEEVPAQNVEATDLEETAEETTVESKTYEPEKEIPTPDLTSEERANQEQRNPWDNYYSEPKTEKTRPMYSPIPEDPKPRKSKGTGKKVLAAVLAIILVAGSCFTTAAIVNSQWKKEAAEMNSAYQSQLAAIESKLSALESKTSGGNGISVSGTVVTTEGLTPAQVYAQNVSSVVAISANTTTTNIYGQQTETASTGSGFFLTSDGYVVTNCHVIEGASSLKVITYDEKEYAATLIGANATNDIALLKVEGENFNAVKIGSSDDLIVGDMVVAIGNPLGQLTSTQTVGYVSAKDRTVTVDNSSIDMIQTDAAINSGNSGGPLFNMKGEVVGITSAKYSGSTSSGASIEGIGFAIPIDDVIKMLTDLKDYGYITGAYLGVSVRSLDSSTAAAYNVPMGVYVESVVEGSCAEKGGVQPQDIIIGMGDSKVTSYNELAKVLRKFNAGDTTTITVYRSGSEITLTVTLDEKPHDTASTTQTAPQQQTPQTEETVPENGSYNDWYSYLEPFFKGQENSEDNNEGNGN